MRKVVGIDRKIKRAWLDAALDRLAQAGGEAELRSFLDRQLREELPSKASRAKSAGIVLRIWGNVPPERLALRDRAVALLARISGQDRIWLHWGMTALAYPFFRDTVEAVGRLLALQDDFTTAQAQGRLLATWGDRATTREAAQKLLTMLVDWQVLRSTKAKGHFLLARKMAAADPGLQLWLVEALLGANPADEIEAQQLLRLPESFPFTLSVGMADLRKDPRFDLHRQGLDMNMVSLVVEQAGPPKTPKRSRRKAPAVKSTAPGLFADQSGTLPPSANGKSRPAPETAVLAPRPGQTGTAVPETNSDEQGRIQSALKQELVRKLSERAAPAIPTKGRLQEFSLPFQDASTQCTEAFRLGHFYASIALTLAVIEAIVRLLGQRTPGGGGESSADDFDTTLELLHEGGLVADDLPAKLRRAWEERHTLFHLKPKAQINARSLVEIARRNLDLLDELKQAAFGGVPQAAASTAAK